MSIDMFWVHTASVQTFGGRGAYGPSYADPIDVACFINDGAHLVRNTVEEEVVSSTTLYAAIADAPKFTPESRVTVSGRVATVITVNADDAGGLPLPEHVEVHLT